MTLSWALASVACASDNSQPSGNRDASLDAGAASDGGGTDSSVPDGGVASAEAAAEADALHDASTTNGDAGDGAADGGCFALVPDAATYVPNPDGDQCIHAASASCFNQFAGLWNCEPTNDGNVWLIDTNGYTYGANKIGQVGEGCTDCSGSWTTISNGQGWVNVGVFTLNDGGTTASLSWNYCNGTTLQDVQTCKQSSTSFSMHTNCTLAMSCANQ